MEDLEKLGSFYLGKEYDLEKRQVADRPLLYEARDLTTHAVCLGMTGSGKTGLGIGLLEEAALDGVPSLVIDPKGDITNLLLTFPDLRPEDFEPWINLDEARRQKLSVSEYAAQVAQVWRQGLAEWHQGPDRLRRLKEAADFLIYTPGSDAGIPVNILQTLRKPDLPWSGNEEVLREKISGTVSGLLGLVGIEADPVRSREHILLANLFEQAWRAGEDLDLAGLIVRLQKPPLRTLGVFDIDTFFPEKDRFELALMLNSLVAAPGFAAWIEGQPLDVAQFLRAPDGRPRVSIFYIAHLSDAERMFFVSLLLGQIIIWLRSQPGTPSLRALLYFDEVFGYFPPHPANPPSKRPLLTLLKQARALGLGVVLTTQNPVDLDYKGLSNAGTWFIGKLQTERDRNRVMEGLEGAIAEIGLRLDRPVLSRLLSSLDSRVFLMHNVHEDRPILFQTRWTMSYLRGPLTRLQIQELMAGRKAVSATPSSAAVSVAVSSDVPLTPLKGLSAIRPTLSPRIDQYFLPIRISLEQAVRAEEQQRGQVAVKEQRLVYEPSLLGLARVRFVHSQSNTDHQETVVRLSEPPEGPLLRWEDAEAVELESRDLGLEPFGEALFLDVPASLTDPTRLSIWRKEFVAYLCRTMSVDIPYNPILKVYGHPHEPPRVFKQRCRETARERRDAEVEKLEKRYAVRLKRLEERLAREERELAEDQAEYEARKREEWLSAGESVLGFMFGRRHTRAVSTASRKRRLTIQARAEVEESEEVIEELQKDIETLKEELQAEIEAVTRKWAETLDQVEEIRVIPRQTDVTIEVFGIGWAPRWYVTLEDSAGSELKLNLSAFSE